MKTKPPVGCLQPRFALLHHTMEAAAGRFDHWDLMLEHAGALVTFEVTRLPSQASPFHVRRLADHRLAYLDYEGHVSGNRGQVIRLDRGRYHEEHADDQSHSERRFRYVLQGQRLKATIGCDQPIQLLPFGQLVLLEAVQWEWHD
jgi:hypothetical protein